MASLSELMKNRNGGNAVGASGSAATSGRSLSQLMGIPTRSEREGLGDLSISKLNENRQRMVQQRINAAKQAEWEEKQRQQALRARYVGQDSLVGQMQKDRAAAAVASANAQVTVPKSPGLDDNSLAYQMLRDRAASEQKQQTLPFEERIHNALNSSGDLASVYHKFPEITGSLTGTPAQDALNDYLMRRTDYSTYQTAPDFEKYSEMGNALKSPSFDRETLHTFMTENEKKTYSYLLAKEGEQSAQRYLDSITETLNRRYGEKIAADVEGVRGTYLHPIVTAGVAAQSGLDRFAGGVAQAFSKYERPTSVMQYAGQAVREDQGAVGKFAYDAVNTLSNMAPSILASFLTAGLGAPAAVASFAAAGTLGLGSGGNAYKQALEEGHSKEEAQTVAILTGASEAVLSKLLSGISAFGGVSAEKLLPKVAAIENAAWRVLGAAGVKLGGEIAEEELQNFLEPLFKTIVYGDEYDVPTIGELAYTAFLTALTTGVLEGGEIAQYRTKEGAASAAQTEVQRTAQGSAESVSEQSSIPGGGQAKNAPVASQTEQRAVSTGLRDPMQVLLEENRKAQAQKNENPAAEMQQDVKKVSTVAKAPGFYKNDRFGGTDEDAAYLDRLAKAAGVSIEMAEFREGNNGWITNGEIHISEKAEDPLRVVAKHEVTHHLKDAAGDAYGQFRNYVEEIYRSRGTLDQQIAAIQTLYRQNGQELSRDAAMDELAADYAGELLENKTLIRKLAGEDRNLAQRIFDSIRDLIRRIKTAFGSAEVKQLDKAARLWEAALKETNAAYQRGEVVNDPGVRNAFADKKIPTYNELIAKPNVKVVDIRNSGGVYSKENRFVDSDRAQKQYEHPVLNKDTGEYVFIHKGSFTKSFSEKGSDKAALAEHLSEIIENAVLTHSDISRKAMDDHTTGVYTLFSAVQTDTGVRPVRLKVKEYRLEGQDIPSNIKEYFAAHGESNPYASAYAGKVLILEEINKEEASSSASSTTEKSVADQYPSASSEISVRDLLSLVNTEYQKYIPQERQSVKGSRDLQKQIDALERQNQRLKEQMKRTDIPKVRRDIVKRSAKDLRSMYSSRIDLDVLTDRIENVYNQLAKLSGAGNLQELDGIPSWDEVRSEMRSIADAILAESRGNVNPMTEEYGEIRKELRGRKISIADEYRADLESAGGYEGIRKQNFGTFSLSKDGTPIDTVYDELNEKYPTLFPDDIVHPADQLIRLSDVMEDLKAVEGNPFESNLDTTAQYLAGEIEERFYDTPNQKPTLADKMENTYHRQRIKDQKELRAKLSGQKRAYEQQVNEIHERYAAENRQRIENQNAAQRRETIYRHAKRLATKLLRPTNKQHVPEELRGAAYNLIRYINLESGYELSYGKGADYRRVPKGSELDAEPNSRTLAAIALKDKLEKMAGKENMTVVIDPDMSDYLDKIALMGDKTLQQMTRAELDTVWKVMQIVEHTINRANELHEQGRYENLGAMARAVDETNKGRRQRTDYVKIVGAVDKFLNFDMLSPETFFHKLGKPGDEIYRMMRKAADRQTEIYNEGVSKAQKLVEESGADFSKLDKKLYDFDFGERGKITLSKSQIMELYALSRRDQAKEHIIQGGLKAVGAAKGIVDQSNVQPVKVTWEEVGQITSKLTDKEKKLVEGLQAYLSNELAGHGNKETLKVYGYGKFKERFYWPIKVSGTETSSDPGKAAHAKTIPGYGMTKNTEPDANNAVELHSAIDTFANHLNQMATYAAWLGTNEDITRLINYRFDNSDNTMKRILATVYGKNGEKYINDLLSDIAQGTKAGQDRTLSESVLSQWKAAKVGGNLRVVVQQPTAILRAMTMLDPKYMVASANVKTGWEKAKKYAPIAQWKDWGYFEIGTGRSLRELITGTESGIEKIKNSLMWAAGAADSVSWGYLWNAVERETADKHPELAKGSEEFYQAVADRFSEIVDRTQVVDSVLHRTQVMRSGNALNKMATSFMSEPSKVYNMVARDLYDIAAADGQAARNRAYKALGKSSAALITSFAVNALMQSLVDAARDDDRDKEYWEKFAENYFGITGEEGSFKEYHDNFWSGNFWQNFNPFSYVPYVKDVLSIAQGYEVDRTDMAAISDLATALQQFFKSLSGEGKKTTLVTGIDAVAKICDLIGIPVSNLKRDAESIFDTMLNEFELYNVQYELDKIVYNEGNSSGVFFDDLYRTMNNDYDTYEEIYEDMYESLIERGYEKDKAAEKISDAMEDRMKKELGVQSVKSLPVRYSPPTTENDEDPFYALLKKAKEADTGWVEQLDPGSIEIALAVDEVRDTDTLEKIKTVAAQPYGEDLKRLAMRNFMGDSQWYRYLSAHNAGVTSMEYAEFLEKLAAEAKRRTGKEDAAPSQADVLEVLKKSKLNAKQKRAIWNGYGWKSDSPW